MTSCSKSSSAATHGAPVGRPPRAGCRRLSSVAGFLPADGGHSGRVRYPHRGSHVVAGHACGLNVLCAPRSLGFSLARCATTTAAVAHLKPERSGREVERCTVMRTNEDSNAAIGMTPLSPLSPSARTSGARAGASRGSGGPTAHAARFYILSWIIIPGCPRPIARWVARRVAGRARSAARSLVLWRVLSRAAALSARARGALSVTPRNVCSSAWRPARGRPRALLLTVGGPPPTTTRDTSW